MIFIFVVNSLSSYLGANPAFPQGKSPTSGLASQLEETCSLVLSFELNLAPWPVRTRTRLFICNELSIFIFKVETRFMLEGIELWILFSSPRPLNTESFFWKGGEFDDVASIMILVKTEGLGCSPFFNL